MKFRNIRAALSGAAAIVAATALAACASTGSSTGSSSKVPDKSVELVKDMKIGWNLGNTLDAFEDGARNQGLASETCWGQPKTTPEMFKGLYRSGIRTVRIPITWHNHIADNNYTIDPDWMARAKEIVGYALDAGLYVIINSHHDTAAIPNFGYAQGYYPLHDSRNPSISFLTRVWEQVAEAFKDYDNHLIFELMNEPRLRGHDREWWYDAENVDCKNALKEICDYEQRCLDVIRKSGGNNASRYVMVPGYVASPWGAMNDVFKLPTDSAADRLVVAVHAYDPWVFAGEHPGVKEFTDEAREGIKSTFDKLGETFVQKGIGVVVGECGATNKNNLDQREAWFRYYFGQAKKNGITAIMWDNGSAEVGPDGNTSEHYGYYNRTEQKWYFPSLLKAALDGVADGERK